MVGKVSSPFDEVKYNALLEGLEVSEVLYSAIDNENRYDSEYFQKLFLKTENLLSSFNHLQIGNFSKVTDGEHGSVKLLEKGIKYLTAENVKKGFVDITKVRYVNEEVHIRNARAAVEIGDILVSIKGTLGEIAIVEPWLLPANMNRDVAIIKLKDKKNINSEYLGMFLMSKYGNIQSQRGGSGGVQQMITLGRLRKFLIPVFSNEFQDKIKFCYQKSLETLKTSQNLYTTAEAELLAALGLSDYQPSTENVQVKSLKDSFLNSGRLDAEYYQPKYEEVEAKIRDYGFVKIREVFYQNTERVVFEKDGYNYIEISDISVSDGKATSSYRLTDDLPANAKIKIKKGDLLISKVRPNRGAVSIIDINKKDLVASGAFTVLREKDECLINKETLQILLRTKVYKELLLKYNCGSSYPVIKDEDVLNLDIPLVPKELQAKISNAIQQSFKLKTQSKQLLHIAKTGVEKAIESSEAEAMTWMGNEIANLENLIR